jgi:hypothetical protein
MPTMDLLFLSGYTTVIYIRFLTILPVVCIYEVDKIFIMVLHFYNIKINNIVLKWLLIY